VPFLKRNSIRVLLPAGCLSAIGLAAVCWLASRGLQDHQTTAPVSNTQGVHAPGIVVQSDMQAQVGTRFELLPATSNLDGAPRFSAENLPAWASLDPATGRIVGTPGIADIGQYESITLVVASGVHRAATQPFNITVVGAGSGVATLEWRVPSSKVDGSSLDDLAGYRISYGRDAELLDHNIFIDDPAQTSYEFAMLDSGTWYFAVTALNANGLEGPSTVPVRKTI